MKKLTILTSVMALAITGSYAQGFFNASTGTTTERVTVQDPAVNNGVAVFIGTTANAAGFVGLGPSSVVFQAYIGTDGESLAALLASTPFYTSQVLNSANTTLAGAQGTFPGGNPFTLPTGPNYDGTKKVEVVFTALSLNGAYAGTTSIADLLPATGVQSVALFGPGAGQISSFVMSSTPEPTTIALGGIGAAALLYFRRRK